MAESRSKAAEGAPEVSQQRAEQAAEELLSTSSDARHSSYREANPDELDLADEKLPPGRIVVQERGEPSEKAEQFSANRGRR